jgi:hypothetical protein
MESGYNNCFFVLFYLILRGKAAKIVFVSSHGKLRHFIAHFLVVDEKDNVLHFHHLLAHEFNPFAPWWFKGKVVVVHKNEAAAALKASGRRVLWTTDSLMLGLLLCTFIWKILFIPWMVCWTLYPIYWNLKSGVDAIRKNKKLREWSRWCHYQHYKILHFIQSIHAKLKTKIGKKHIEKQ